MAKRRQKHDRASAPASAVQDPRGIRLQRVLASAGFGSRRSCEEIITDGRVQIDKKVVTELGTRVDPNTQTIKVDGETLRRPRLSYYMVNKPLGVLSTNSDPDGRSRVIDLIGDRKHLFPVGRLDKESQGLILVTNDGDLAYKLTHPKFQVPKTYQVRVAGVMRDRDIKKVTGGIYLSDGFARVESIQIKRRHKQSTDLEMILTEGINREIRRVLARVGHKVLSLKRVAIGRLKLGSIKPGDYRLLEPQEVKQLMRLVEGDNTSTGGGRPERRPSNRSSTGNRSQSKSGSARSGRSGRSGPSNSRSTKRGNTNRKSSGTRRAASKSGKNKSSDGSSSGTKPSRRGEARVSDNKQRSRSATKKRTVRKATSRKSSSRRRSKNTRTRS